MLSRGFLQILEQKRNPPNGGLKVLRIKGFSALALHERDIGDYVYWYELVEVNNVVLTGTPDSRCTISPFEQMLRDRLWR